MIRRKGAGSVMMVAGAILIAIWMGDLAAQQTAVAPSIRIKKTVRTCSGFDDTVSIHPDRYLPGIGARGDRTPVIYDIEKDSVIEIPDLDGLPGLPTPPGVPPASVDRHAASAMKLRGDYWRWSGRKLVLYSPERNIAGIVYTRVDEKKTMPGSPPCGSCGGATELIEKYHRYYCRSCKAYVPEKNYISEVYSYIFAAYDLKAGRIAWTASLEMNASNPFEQNGIGPIGVDPSGRYFYYTNMIHFYRHNRSSGNILLYRFNIDDRKVDRRHRIEVPVRFREGSAGSYSIHVVPSMDMKRILFWEYDEASESGGGHLKNPAARGYVMEPDSGSHFIVPVPVTPYGSVFDFEGRYLVLGSNQTGTLHRYDLAGKKEDLKVPSKRGIFRLIISGDSRFLFVFHKKGVEVLTWPAMARVKSLPMSSILPGVTELLVSVPMYVTARGRYAAICVLQKQPSGPWWACDRNGGFQLLQIGD